MNTQQLQYALAIAEHGSISKAAQSLFVSQPHLSKSIQSLEAEIQYPIFVRKANGIVPTSQGIQFLNKARTMMENYQDIMSLSTTDTIRSFRVSGMNLFMVASAFCNTCREFQDDLLDFCLVNQGAEKTIEEVYTGKANIGILTLPEATIDSFLATFHNKRIAYRDIFRVTMAITLREGHPLLNPASAEQIRSKPPQDGELPLPVEKLREYPCVDYAENDGLKVLGAQHLSCINREKMILVNEMVVRHRLVSQTDAFCIGCALDKDTLSAYHLRSFPIPGTFSHLVYIYRGDNELSEECQVFIRHLEKETKLYYPE